MLRAGGEGLARAAGSAEGSLEVGEVRFLFALLGGGVRLAFVGALLLVEAVASKLEAVGADLGRRDEVGGRDVGDLDAVAGGGSLGQEVEVLFLDAAGAEVEVDVEFGEVAPKAGLGLLREGGAAAGLQVRGHARGRVLWAPGCIS